jgi:hypothetical protein
MSGLAFLAESWKADALRRCVLPAALFYSEKPAGALDPPPLGPTPTTFSEASSRARHALCVSSVTARTWIGSAESRRRASSIPAPRRVFSTSCRSSRSIASASTGLKPRVPTLAWRRCKASARISTNGATRRSPRVTRFRRLPMVCGLVSRRQRSGGRHSATPFTPPNCSFPKPGYHSWYPGESLVQLMRY